MQQQRTPQFFLVAAVLVPLALQFVNVLVNYLPGLPGAPPRDIGLPLLLLAATVAVVLFQFLPFTSWTARVFLTVAFGGTMWAVLLMTFFFGACIFGDCM